jgi:hypothetical protein
MREGGWYCQRRSCGEGLKQMGAALHDLCQPMTTLQCRLEMASITGTAEGYREAVDLSMVECARLIEAVRSMREIVRAAVLEAEAEATAAGSSVRVTGLL